MPDLTPPRKRPRRFWLFAPYVLALIAALVWTAVWFELSARIQRQMDEGQATLRARGWTVDWAARTVDGYPFRLAVTLTNPHIAEPSGWSLSAPTLKGQAYAYAPGHWVLVAAQGVVLDRPRLGAVTVSGQALRASLDLQPGQPTPRIAIEGLRLSLATAVGATPLPITACDHLGLYLRPLDGDQAEFQLKLDGAAPTAGSLFDRLDPGQPVGVIWDQSLTHASSLQGHAWPDAVRAWSAAGGALTLVHGELSAGDLVLTAKSGQMTIDAEGRPVGAIKLDLSRATAARGPLEPALALASLVRSELDLKDGGLFLGPFRVASAPRVY